VNRSKDLDVVAGEQNLFSIGRRRHGEDQLTEMLAWLASGVPAVAHFADLCSRAAQWIEAARTIGVGA
jgi:hypothetical protein